MREKSKQTKLDAEPLEFCLYLGCVYKTYKHLTASLLNALSVLQGFELEKPEWPRPTLSYVR